jgi:hypothetical protein
MRHFRLACASNYHVERDVEMIQKLDDGRKVTVLRIRRSILPGCFGLDDCMKENFEGVCEKNQMPIVRREGHRLLYYLASCQMKAQNAMQKRMRLWLWLENALRTRLTLTLVAFVA